MQLLDTHKDLVLFDGVCNLCTASVNFILKWEKSPKLKFASLQSPDGILIMSEITGRGMELDSLLLIKDGKLHTHSTAALLICQYLKFPISLGVIFLLVPRFLRDIVYRLIARNRYSWFGKKSQCMVPEVGVKERFLD